MISTKENLNVRITYKSQELKYGNMARDIYKAFLESGKKELIVFNVGSDLTIGDSLGPFIGTLLEYRDVNIRIMGTLDNPIHAINVEEHIKYVKKHYQNSFILATDAALGDADDIGDVVLRNKPIRPGAGVGRKLNEIGDYSIVGVVSKKTLGFKGLTNTRISFVMQIAKKIVDEIIILEKLLHNN